MYSKIVALILVGMIGGRTLLAASSEINTRYGLPITSSLFEKAVVETKAEQKSASSRIHKVKNFLFRASLERPNHFFVENHRIQVETLAHDKSTGKTSLALSFFLRQGQVEEKLGRFYAQGYLSPQQNPTSFQGFKQHRFLDKWGFPILQIDLGQPHKGTISEMEKAKAVR